MRVSKPVVEWQFWSGCQNELEWRSPPVLLKLTTRLRQSLKWRSRGTLILTPLGSLTVNRGVKPKAQIL